MLINTYHRNQSLSFSILQILIYSNQLCVDSEKLSLEVVVRPHLTGWRHTVLEEIESVKSRPLQSNDSGEKPLLLGF